MPVMIDHLSTYLQDHRAGAEFGSSIARRLCEENEGTQYAAVLCQIADEIDADVQTLEEIMDRFDIGKDRLKIAGATIGEKLGRLKPNNALTDYSPLSRVLEIETLRSGVQGKRALWDSLENAAAHDDRLDAAEMAALGERADSQLARLRQQHGIAASEAFAPI